MVPEKEQKNIILEEILASPEFRESKRYQELLKYLFDCTEEGNAPKEITIAMHFFGKGSDFDPKEDTTVRVHINTLRKKLEHYYFTSEHHPYQLIIPKGRYQVEFIEVKQKPDGGGKQTEAGETTASGVPTTTAAWKNNSRVLLAALLLAFVLGGAAGWYLSSGGSQREQVNNPVWTEFLQKDGRPTLVLLGDFFFLFEKTNVLEKGKFIRDVSVNSPEDYKQRVRRDPEFAAKYVESDFTFLRPSASWGLSSILPILGKAPKGYTLKLASQFSIDDAKNYNIIYIGSFKNLYDLQKLLHIFKISFQLSPAGFHITGKDSTRFYSPANFKGGNYERDYAVAAKAMGPEGSTLLLLTGFGDTGVIEAARFIADQASIDKISKGSATAPPLYFTAVVETEGINQSIFKTYIHYLDAGSSPAPTQDTSR